MNELYMMNISSIRHIADKKPVKRQLCKKKGLIWHFLSFFVLYSVLFPVIRGLLNTMIATMVAVLLVDVALRAMRGRSADSDILLADIIGLVAGMYLAILTCAINIIIRLW